MISRPPPLPIALCVGLGLLWGSQRPSTGWIWILGCILGWVLVSGRFGFSAPIRRLISEGDAQSLAPLTILLTLLVLGSGLLFQLAQSLGISLQLSRAPISFSLVGGAFLFGIGMQMARRYASGTLVSTVRADAEFGSTLVGLVVGVFLGSLHRPALEKALPIALPPMVLLDQLPLGAAVLTQLGVLLLCFEALLAVSRWRLNIFGPLPLPTRGNEPSPPSMATVLGLAILLLLLFGVSGEPWRVLWGLALSSGHLAQSVGWEPQTSSFWGAPSRLALLSEPWIQHESVVVNLGVIYGACISGAQPACRRLDWARWNIPPTEFLRHGLGGLLMGYGGFLAYGCNISSFLGGVMSFSLHGWVWLLATFAGSACWLQWEFFRCRVKKATKYAHDSIP